MDIDEIVEYLKPMYRDVRVLPDGTVAALVDLITTRSIMLDCDEFSFKRRFCFSSRALADQRFAELQSAQDIPQGYVARRPEWEDRADPYLNQLHNRPWNKEFEVNDGS